MLPTNTDPQITSTQTQSHFIKESSMNMPLPTSEPIVDANTQTIVLRNNKIEIETSLNNVKQNATQWYKTNYRTLYIILGQCYELYYLIEEAPTDDRDTYKEEVKNAYGSLKGAQGAKNLRSRIVSVVFNFSELDRKVRSRYATVLTRAFNHADKPTDSASFTTWLEDQGGIVAALSKKNGSEVTNKTPQIEINSKIRSLPVKARVALPNSGNRFVVLLAQGVNSSTVDILYQFEDDTLCESIATRAFKAVEKGDDSNDKKSPEYVIASFEKELSGTETSEGLV